MADPSKEPEMRVIDRRWWARSEPVETDEPSDPVEPARAVDTRASDHLEQELTQTREQLQSVLTEYRRATDEFEQVRVRMRRDVAREVERGQRALLVEMLDVVDNLDRAIESARQHTEGSSSDVLLRGVELVREQFLAKLAALSVVKLEVLGSMFDPTQHDAVSLAPAETPDHVGRVVAVVREGYLIGDDVLRPAGVIVGANG